MIQLLATTIDERTKPVELERIRRNLAEAVRELQATPAASARIIKDVTLDDGVLRLIPHGLGRRAFVTHSPPRNATNNGRIEEVSDGTFDRSQYVGLKAIGYGAPIVVDVEVK